MSGAGQRPKRRRAAAPGYKAAWDAGSSSSSSGPSASETASPAAAASLASAAPSLRTRAAAVPLGSPVVSQRSRAALEPLPSPGANRNWRSGDGRAAETPLTASCPQRSAERTSSDSAEGSARRRRDAYFFEPVPLTGEQWGAVLLDPAGAPGPGGAFSITARVRLRPIKRAPAGCRAAERSHGDMRYVLSATDGWWSGWALGVCAGQWALRLGVGASRHELRGPRFAPGQWHSVAAGHDGLGRSVLSVDGQRIEGRCPSWQPDMLAPLRAGAGPRGGSGCRGEIRVLSVSPAAPLAGPRPPPPPAAAAGDIISLIGKQQLDLQLRLLRSAEEALNRQREEAEQARLQQKAAAEALQARLDVAEEALKESTSEMRILCSELRARAEIVERAASVTAAAVTPRRVQGGLQAVVQLGAGPAPLAQAAPPSSPGRPPPPLQPAAGVPPAVPPAPLPYALTSPSAPPPAVPPAEEQPSPVAHVPPQQQQQQQQPPPQPGAPEAASGPLPGQRRRPRGVPDWLDMDVLDAAAEAANDAVPTVESAASARAPSPVAASTITEAPSGAALTATWESRNMLTRCYTERGDVAHAIRGPGDGSPKPEGTADNSGSVPRSGRRGRSPRPSTDTKDGVVWSFLSEEAHRAPPSEQGAAPAGSPAGSAGSQFPSGGAAAVGSRAASGGTAPADAASSPRADAASSPRASEPAPPSPEAAPSDPVEAAVERLAAQVRARCAPPNPVPREAMHPCRVRPWLVLGDQRGARKVAELRRLGVCNVVNLAGAAARTKAAMYGGISYHELPTEDAEGYPLLEQDLPKVSEIAAAAREAGGAVFIHCLTGANRSGAIAAALLMQMEGLGLLSAVGAVRDAFPLVLQGHRGFARQLVMLAARRRGAGAGQPAAAPPEAPGGQHWEAWDSPASPLAPAASWIHPDPPRKRSIRAVLQSISSKWRGPRGSQPKPWETVAKWLTGDEEADVQGLGISEEQLAEVKEAVASEGFPTLSSWDSPDPSPKNDAEADRSERRRSSAHSAPDTLGLVKRAARKWRAKSLGQRTGPAVWEVLSEWLMPTADCSDFGAEQAALPTASSWDNPTFCLSMAATDEDRDLALVSAFVSGSPIAAPQPPPRDSSGDSPPASPPRAARAPVGPLPVAARRRTPEPAPRATEADPSPGSSPAPSGGPSPRSAPGASPREAAGPAAAGAGQSRTGQSPDTPEAPPRTGASGSASGSEAGGAPPHGAAPPQSAPPDPRVEAPAPASPASPRTPPGGPPDSPIAAAGPGADGAAAAPAQHSDPAGGATQPPAPQLRGAEPEEGAASASPQTGPADQPPPRLGAACGTTAGVTEEDPSAAPPPAEAPPAAEGPARPLHSQEEEGSPGAAVPASPPRAGRRAARAVQPAALPPSAPVPSPQQDEAAAAARPALEPLHPAEPPPAVALPEEVLARWVGRVRAACPMDASFKLLSKPARITPGLYLGNSKAARGVGALRELGVTHIVNCAPLQARTPRALYEEGGLTVIEIPAVDDPDFALIPRFARQVSAQVCATQRAGGATLVHCFQGVNRSAALVIAHLMLAERVELLAACARTHAARPVILQGNDGFVRQLVELAAAEELLGEGAPAVSPRGASGAGAAPDAGTAPPNAATPQAGAQAPEAATPAPAAAAPTPAAEAPLAVTPRSSPPTPEQSMCSQGAGLTAAELQRWAAAVRDSCPPDPVSRAVTRPCAVRPWLVIGDQRAARKVPELRKLGVTHVLNLAGAAARTSAALYGGMEHHSAQTEDAEDYPLLERHLAAAADLASAAREQGGALFVHCLTGANRSGAIAVALLMQAEGLELFAAVEAVHSAFPLVLQGHPGFARQLAAFAHRRGLLQVDRTTTDPDGPDTSPPGPTGAEAPSGPSGTGGGGDAESSWDDTDEDAPAAPSPTRDDWDDDF
eukprot:TRINITY_DN7644_c0_g2_i7.p1 TRINITY_DN7644_c0_g2~~TRINITY_DN7644_c0_g2_i7.p1  ORF type:complete len:1940 (+),score=473.44 TRINITY_DN7644_c0_g2_i7:66-5822(+)